ncbi:MAG TPA: radical SAM protein [Chthoniobacterales bacterium]
MPAAPARFFRLRQAIQILPIDLRAGRAHRTGPVEAVLARSLTVNEIYASVQGESTWVGLPCTFVRLTFCDLRCTYCDTAYAFYRGEKMPVAAVVERVIELGINLVEITGGEPLLQKGVLPLMKELCDRSYRVLLETSGAHDISGVDSRVHRIMDLKTPGSGESHRNRLQNLTHLTPRDEVKFVIGSRDDYLWSADMVRANGLAARCHCVLFSPVFGRIEPRQIVEWLLADRLPVRFQLQLHKFIWAPDAKGV